MHNAFNCLSLVILALGHVGSRYIEMDVPLEEQILQAERINDHDIYSENWINEALDDIKEKLNQHPNTNRAKNVIFFMGDGMSTSTITAARIHQGQQLNKTGEEHVLSFEKFPATGFSKTYCVNQQTADSACAATAFMSGVKANFFTIGVNAKVKLNDCVASKDPANRTPTIVQWAQEAGKATGIITTARITDASPAGGYAYVPLRFMESDGDNEQLKMDSSCDFDIAKQLVRENPGKNIKVLMGGGIQKLLPKNKKDVFGNAGHRLETDLIEEWKNDKLKRNLNAEFVTNKDELKKLNISNTDYLLGLFSTSHMHYRLEKVSTEPTLEEMTTASIKLLQKESKGFFLYVEGALIDKAHHENKARYAIDEAVEFAKAIEAAVKLTNEKDTLIVVTADHSQPLVMNGYAKRGNDILGVTSIEANVKDLGEGSSTMLNFKMQYLTLNYGNGPGFTSHLETDLKNNVDIKSPNYKYPSLYPLQISYHTGEDVAVYARGPWSHLFNGNYEQTVIPMAEAYAAGIGPSKSIKEIQRNNGHLMGYGQMWFTLVTLVVYLM